MNADPNPVAGLGLPATWVPASWPITPAIVELSTSGGPVRVHVLLIDTPTGRIGIALDDAMARKLADQLYAQTSGLTVAQTLPADKHGGN